MKNHYLTILSLASLAVLAGCASNGNNQTAQNVDSTASAVTETQPEPQPAQPVDDGIDWEKPLYEIQSNGDTAYRLEYDANGRITKKFADYYEENRCGCIVYYNYDDTMATSRLTFITTLSAILRLKPPTLIPMIRKTVL